MKKIVLSHNIPKEYYEEYVTDMQVAVPKEPLTAWTKEEAKEVIKDADIFICYHDFKMDQELIDSAENLEIVGNVGSGYDNVDWRYAKEKGIPVMNVPVYGTDNVSQFAVSLLLEVCSHIGHHSDSVHAGEWASNADWCYWHYPMIEVSGKTAGIIGLGRIGVNTAKILKAMNVNVIAYDAFQSEAGKQVATYVELDELLAKSERIAKVIEEIDEKTMRWLELSELA